MWRRVRDVGNQIALSLYISLAVADTLTRHLAKAAERGGVLVNVPSEHEKYIMLIAVETKWAPV